MASWNRNRNIITGKLKIIIEEPLRLLDPYRVITFFEKFILRRSYDVLSTSIGLLFGDSNKSAL